MAPPYDAWRSMNLAAIERPDPPGLTITPNRLALYDRRPFIPPPPFDTCTWDEIAPGDILAIDGRRLGIVQGIATATDTGGRETRTALIIGAADWIDVPGRYPATFWQDRTFYRYNHARDPRGCYNGSTLSQPEKRDPNGFRLLTDPYRLPKDHGPMAYYSTHSTRITVAVPNTTREAIDREAARREISAGELVREAIHKHLGITGEAAEMGKAGAPKKTAKKAPTKPRKK